MIPAKPIKHRTKIPMLCCAYTGVNLTFQIYFDGKEDSDGKMLATVLWLCEKADLLHTKSPILFTDNY